MGDYPEEIVIDPGSEEYDLLVGHSDLIDSLADVEGGGPIPLTADVMFQGDEEKWKNFVDIFFPGLSGKKYFGYKNNSIYVLNERGGKAGLRDMLDFMMVDSPDTMMNFAKKQARKQLNAPSMTVPRGVGITTPGRGAREYAAQRAALRNNNNVNHVGLWNNLPSRYESNNENEPRVNRRPEVRVNNNNNEGSNKNNNGSNTTVASRPRPFTLANFMPPSNSRRSNRRTRRNKTRRTNRKQSRRATRK
jgi:hypothetical protein